MNYLHINWNDAQIFFIVYSAISVIVLLIATVVMFSNRKKISAYSPIVSIRFLDKALSVVIENMSDRAFTRFLVFGNTYVRDWPSDGVWGQMKNGINVPVEKMFISSHNRIQLNSILITEIRSTCKEKVTTPFNVSIEVGLNRQYCILEHYRLCSKSEIYISEVLPKTMLVFSIYFK